MTRANNLEENDYLADGVNDEQQQEQSVVIAECHANPSWVVVGSAPRVRLWRTLARERPFAIDITAGRTDR